MRKTFMLKKNKKVRKTFKKMRGGFHTSINIDGSVYNINLYQKLPDDIRENAKIACGGMYESYSDADTSELVYDYLASEDNDIYILSDHAKEFVSFIIMKNAHCEASMANCFNCKEVKCSYIKLTCVRKEKRGMSIFKHFLKGVEDYLKTKDIKCIRLTALNKTVFNIYKKIGFESEISGEDACDFQMIKRL